MWTVRDAGQPPLPPPQVLERVPGWGRTKDAAGGGSDVGISFAPTVQCWWGGSWTGWGLQISRVPSCPGWWWHPSQPHPAMEDLHHPGLGWTGSTKQECLPTCRRYFLQGGSTSHPTIWQQNLGPFLEGFGASWGISHSCRLPDGEDA